MKAHPFETMADLSFRRNMSFLPHITREQAHYVVRPSADLPGAYLVISRKASPDDLRAIADLIEQERAR